MTKYGETGLPVRHLVRAALLIATLAATAASLVGAQSTGVTATPAAEAAYLAENDAAMNKMMRAMGAMATGDVDRDFVTMMVPHHQGAIDMALAVLRYGHNDQIRRLAQEIIVDQRQEIVAMRLAVGDQPPSAVLSPTEQRNDVSTTEVNVK